MSFMLEDQAHLLGGAGPVGELALLVDKDWTHAVPAAVVDFLRKTRAIVREEQAIELRTARVLAWSRTQDVSEVGYASWSAFCKENCSWSPSWRRALVRLVESPLELVKEAVSRDLLPLSTAVRAPTELGPSGIGREEQRAWLEKATQRTHGDEPAPPARQGKQREVVSGEGAHIIERSRELAGLLLGWPAPVSTRDAYVREAWERKVPGGILLDRAREAPPVPERLSRVLPVWGAEPDPATGLLGPWVQPLDLPAAVRLLEDLENVRRGRSMLLGMAFSLIRAHRFWKEVGGNSLEAFAVVHLGRSLRTFQRYAKLGMELSMWPEVRRAVEAGLSLDRADFVVQFGGQQAIEDWLGLARRLGRAELERASTSGQGALAAYAPAVRKAEELERATGNGAVVQVALRENSATPCSVPAYRLVPPGQLEAATWFVGVVVLPPEVGVRRTAVRDRRTCQNPGCRQRTIRAQVHHTIQKQHGGSDDSSNLVTLCPGCHLRGVHSSRMKVRREGDFLIWTRPWCPEVAMYSPSD
jgi:hypothetical protein